jgi:hypothetical protein
MSEMPKKAKFGEPCSNCGLCCAAQLCDIAEGAFPGASAPCPALEWHEGRSWCGLVTNPTRHINPHFAVEDRAEADAIMIPLFLQVIPIGQGCGMED